MSLESCDEIARRTLCESDRIEASLQQRSSIKEMAKRTVQASAENTEVSDGSLYLITILRSEEKTLEPTWILTWSRPYTKRDSWNGMWLQFLKNEFDAPYCWSPSELKTLSRHNDEYKCNLPYCV